MVWGRAGHLLSPHCRWPHQALVKPTGEEEITRVLIYKPKLPPHRADHTAEKMSHLWDCLSAYKLRVKRFFFFFLNFKKVLKPPFHSFKVRIHSPSPDQWDRYLATLGGFRGLTKIEPGKEDLTVCTYFHVFSLPYLNNLLCKTLVVKELLKTRAQ